MPVSGRDRHVKWLIAVLLLLIAGCASGPPADPNAVRRTFDKGQNRVPDVALRDGQFRALTEIREYPQDWQSRVAGAKVRPGVRVPAVIYLHGCAGNTMGVTWASQFNRLGYAFFAPESLARPRRSMCGSGKRSMLDIRIPWRIEELRYSLEQIQGLDWIDPQRILLMGSSEGAQAASAYTGNEFAAVVLIGTDCRFVGGRPRTPDGVPVLNMVGSNDNEGGGKGCRITRTVGGSRKVIIEGGRHKLGNNADAMRELEAFLAACCAPPSASLRPAPPASPAGVETGAQAVPVLLADSGIDPDRTSIPPNCSDLDFGQ